MHVYTVVGVFVSQELWCYHDEQSIQDLVKYLLDGQCHQMLLEPPGKGLGPLLLASQPSSTGQPTSTLCCPGLHLFGGCCEEEGAQLCPPARYFLEHHAKALLMAEAEDSFPATHQTTRGMKTASFAEMSYCLHKHSQT